MTPDLIIFYVDDLSRSLKFYENILRTPPMESFSDYAWFSLSNDLGIALWERKSVKPEVERPGTGGELVFPAMDKEEVDAIYANWTRAGAEIIQEPEDRPFGYTFTAADPDGNRLRVYMPAKVVV